MGGIRMKFYCDGSRIGLNENRPTIGWAAVYMHGPIASGAQVGGSNINAEMYAIRDGLKNLRSYRRALLKQIVESGDVVEVVTDSLTSLQIIQGYLKGPESYDLDESLNYRLADEIARYVHELDSLGVTVQWKHVRGHGRDESMTTEDVIGNAFADHVATQEAQRLFDKTDN